MTSASCTSTSSTCPSCRLPMANGASANLYVAIDRRSRSVHLAVKDDETEASAIAFLREAAAALPFLMTHVLTDNGSCFTQAFAKACAELGADYRHTKPRTPQTNGMVERFNGRIGSEVLAITVYSHQQLEQLLRGFNAAYNARRQRVLEAKTPIRSWLSDLQPSPPWPKTNRPDGRVPVTSSRPARSLKTPRRSHNRTSATFFYILGATLN